MKPMLALALVALVAPSAATADDVTVTLEGVHLCCNACVRAIDGAVEDVEGAEATCDRTEATVAVTAPDLKAAQGAVDAIVEAGYHGTPDSDEIEVKDDSGAPEGKVKDLTLTGLHNCCRGCASAVQETLGEVDGVDQVEAEARGETVTLSGDFEARAVVKALNEAGFHVKVKK